MWNIFITPERNPQTHQPSLPYSSPSQALTTSTGLLSVSIDLTILDISYKYDHTKCGPLWLASFTEHKVFRFIHVAAHISTLFLLLLNNISLYGNSTFVYPFISWRIFGLFPFWAIMNNAFMNTVWTYVFNSVGYRPNSGIAESHGNCMISFLKNFKTFFQSGCTILYYRQQCMRIPISLHPCQYLLLPGFLTFVFLVNVKYYLFVVWLTTH